ncbi:hypothetical protein RB1695 [Rhodopirellula baltica SH 1]|uniref:Uncharacterized protein n=1 Tax=Rhodopirellula baltica (strain DSM 10527 / NCIMB 13988 / SH1) TaxID=243090 RepID=Q7UWZ1_RHOBA|nr:hypothetical protein RB1695 [Rhodopirellula baltica SH 1]
MHAVRNRQTTRPIPNDAGSIDFARFRHCVRIDVVATDSIAAARTVGQRPDTPNVLTFRQCGLVLRSNRVKPNQRFPSWFFWFGCPRVSSTYHVAMDLRLDSGPNTVVFGSGFRGDLALESIRRGHRHLGRDAVLVGRFD